MRPGAALVTGAARRIGAVLARALAADGWAVAVHCHRSRVEAEAVIATIRAAGGRAELVQADLNDRDAVAGLHEAAARAVGPLTLLVNNASSFHHDTITSLTPSSWDEGMRSNLEAPVFLARDVAAHLGGRPGAIINITDCKVALPDGDFFSYTIAKLGLAAATEILAREFAGRIRVNAIAPGITLISGKQSQAAFEREWHATPLGRSSTPAEIADAMRFILAAESLNGQTLFLDGGARLV